MISEKQVLGVSGIPFLVVLILALLGFIALLVVGAGGENPGLIVTGVLGMTLVGFCLAGFFIVNPNEGKVLQLFGRYVGTVHINGLRWSNPFFSKKKISMRVRNFETGKLKVNDKSGNPIEIAAVVVWKVVDTAEAMFEVDDFENYVHVQSEAAVRSMATAYPYDAHHEDEISLSGNTPKISKQLEDEIQDRLQKAGVKVIESRISHLAYASEIAAAMLQRQQAGAVVAAREKIVEGAVGMVEMALEHLSRKQVLELDEERKAAMVANLMVVLCSDRHTQPVINTGTLHN